MRDAFSRGEQTTSTSWKMPVLWVHDTAVLTTMDAVPDVMATPKPQKEPYARGLKRKASRLLFYQSGLVQTPFACPHVTPRNPY